MKNTNEKGITLVALVITIIILLILAGITISQLTGSGLFENARLAEEKSKNAQEKENSILAQYEELIAGNHRENEEGFGTSTEIGNLDIQILELNGEYVKIKIIPENEQVVRGYIIELGNEVVEVTKDNEIILSGLNCESNYNITAYAIDKYRNIKKIAKTITTLEHQYLYKEGTDFEVLTGGWTKAIYVGTAELSKDSDSMTFTQPYTASNGSSLSTIQKVDISNYKKLHIEYKLNLNAANANKKFGISTVQTYSGSTWGYVNELALENTGNKDTKELNIEENSGEYYIQSYFNAGAILTVYNMWLE